MWIAGGASSLPTSAICGDRSEVVSAPSVGLYHASRSWQGLILIELGSAHVRLGSGY
jgi:hypothetical protein